MDVTIWCDKISETTFDTTGEKTIPQKSTGHKNTRVSVCLACVAGARRGDWGEKGRDIDDFETGIGVQGLHRR